MVPGAALAWITSYSSKTFPKHTWDTTSGQGLLPVSSFVMVSCSGQQELQGVDVH